MVRHVEGGAGEQRLRLFDDRRVTDVRAPQLHQGADVAEAGVEAREYRHVDPERAASSRLQPRASILHLKPPATPVRRDQGIIELELQRAPCARTPAPLPERG